MRDYKLDYLLGAHSILASDYFDMFKLHSTSTLEDRTSARELMQHAADAVQDYIKETYTRKL